MSKQSREKQQKDQKYKEKHVPNVHFRVNPTKSGMKTNENVTKSELLNSRKSRVPKHTEIETERERERMKKSKTNAKHTK